MLKRESSFSTFRDINVLIVSWNIDAAKPDALTTQEVNVNFLKDVLASVDSPDIISFGFQEAIDLESRRMTAKTLLLGNNKPIGQLSEKVTGAYKRWHDRLVGAVRLAMPADTPYTVIETENMVGLFTCIFIKSNERITLRDTSIATIKRGMGGRYGNKVRISFLKPDSTRLQSNRVVYLPALQSMTAPFVSSIVIWPLVNIMSENAMRM